MGEPKADPALIAYRRRIVIEYWDQGYHPTQIARVLGVSVGTVYVDIQKAAGPHQKRYDRRPDDPPAVDWRHPDEYAMDPDPADPLYLAVEQLLETGRAERWEAGHASQVLDARRRGDNGWLGKWGIQARALYDMAEKLAGMHDGGVDLRLSLDAWRDASEIAGGTPLDSLQIWSLDFPDGMFEEVQRRVNAGLAPGRTRIEHRYGATSEQVRKAVYVALTIKRLLEAGWKPPQKA